MPSIRDLLSGDGSGTSDASVRSNVTSLAAQGKRAEGASQNKLCLRFVPLAENPSFGGEFLALPYHSLDVVRGELDFSRVRLRYTNGMNVILLGPNLKAIADRLEAGRLGDVIQADPMDTVADRHTVTLSIRGDELERLLAGVKTLRTARVESVEAAEIAADGLTATVDDMLFEHEPQR